MVHIHPAGILLLVAAVLFFPSRDVLAAVLALLWHEGAHAAVMLVCRVSQCRIELTPFGGMADAKDFELLHPAKQAAIAASGVVASAIGAWGCMAVLPHNDFVFVLFQNHLSLAFVNCLPAWPLDGARILIAMAAAFGRESIMRKGLSAFSYLLGSAMITCGLYGAWRGQINASLLLAGPYLWYAAREGNVADRLRQIQLSQKKLQNRAMLPVEAVISRMGSVSSLAPAILSRGSANRYHLLIQTDERGKLQHVWTEEEMMETLLECIGTAKK